MNQRARRAIHVMGTVFSIDVRRIEIPVVDVADALDAVEAWLCWVDATFSTYRGDSDISRLATNDITLDDCHPYVAVVLESCAQASLHTDGFFNALLGGRIDPTGLVKGWSAQQASRMLRGAGLPCHAISAGGDVVCAGEPDSGEPWRVGVVDPFDPTEVALVVRVRDGAVATSGIAERGRHVLDPRSGLPSSGLVSATVVGPDLTFADAYATAALAGGDPDPSWARRIDDYELLTIDEAGNVACTPGFASYTEVRPLGRQGAVA